ncbi:MAG: porphobilinogen deaminase [Candidatus Midichloriaceae bacterium]|jgi:hydroxymethylbilane synthase|nr:porphobilinogen deaminase [Candidatus Midichloriaceae bacterium]
MLKIGTRSSKLALTQTQIVIDLLKVVDPKLEFEVVPIVTTGDKLYDANLALVGGKGLFLKELEEHLLAGKIDFAVHSLKDVPAFLPDSLTISCFLERENPFDAFLSAKYKDLNSLPFGAKVGTSSSRRLVQLKSMRPDLEIVPFRGNVITRLNKLQDGVVDACILACAGLKRLGLEAEIKHVLYVDQMLPAVGQGVICIEHMDNNKSLTDLLAQINHRPTEICAIAERAFMKAMSGNCITPLAAYAVIEGETVNLRAMYYSDVKRESIYSSSSTNISQPALAGEECGIKINNIITNLVP